MARLRVIGILAALLLVGATTATAAQAKINNGNFEKGSFKGWKTKTTPSEVMSPLSAASRGGVIPPTRWRLYTKKDRSIGEGGAKVRYGRGVVPTPYKLPKPKGKYSPVIDMSNPGHNVLSRTVKVPASAKSLKLQAFWHNDARSWIFSGSFLNPASGDQYFSIDLLKAGADPESTAKGDHLERLFAPKPDLLGFARRAGTPYDSNGWQSFKTSVKKYQGEKVLLRLAETDTQSFNYVGIDNVKFGK